MSGIGSLVTFQGFDEGVLARGSQTIQAALDVQKAMAIAASTPFPTGVIKNTGAEMSPAEVQGILGAWKRARDTRGTAFLTATLDYTPTSYSPKDMTYNDSLQYLATEIARLCNIPAYMLSADMNNSMTYSNVMDERKQFFAYSLMPYLDAIAARLSMDDITAHGNEVRFEVTDTFLRTEPLDRLAAIEKMLALNLITLDQAREMEDLTPMGNSEENNGESDPNI
jgi:HK97 family phage portal protein